MDRRLLTQYLKNSFNLHDLGFKFSKNGNTTLLSTSFGIQLNYLIGEMNTYPIDDISSKLINLQDEKTGLYFDRIFDMRDISRFDSEYIHWQIAYFSTIALDMIGKLPKYPFYFLEELKQKDKLMNWFNGQNFNDFWYTSNKIMFLLYFLTYETERLNICNDQIIDLIFDILDSKQDTHTGFWGTNLGATLENGMFGASHIYLYYDFYERKINYKDKIIDCTINLQNTNGLYGSKYGGACEDYDAIEIFSILGKSSDYKKELVKNTLKGLHEIIDKKQNSDGGFSYYIDNRSIIEKINNKISRNEPCYLYSGWNKMKANCFNSDMWATYFRVLSLAKIEKFMGNDNKERYRFYPLPGWGYY